MKLPQAVKRNLKRYYTIKAENLLRREEIKARKLDLDEAEIIAEMEELNEEGETQTDLTPFLDLAKTFIGGLSNAGQTNQSTGYKTMDFVDAQDNEDRKPSKQDIEFLEK